MAGHTHLTSSCTAVLSAAEQSQARCLQTALSQPDWPSSRQADRWSPHVCTQAGEVHAGPPLYTACLKGWVCRSKRSKPNGGGRP